MRPLAAALLLAVSVPLLAQTADLRIVPQTSRPGPLKPGDFGSITIAVQNIGPDVARNLRVEFTGTPGLTFTRSLATESCDFAPTKVVCSFGDFAPGVTFSGADFDVPYAAGTHTVTARAITDSTDPNPQNDSGSISVETHEISGIFGGFVSISPYKSDPGGLTVVDTYLDVEEVVPDGAALEAKFTVTNGTIESFEPQSPWNCSSTAPTTLSCTATAPLADCCNSRFRIGVRASSDRGGGVAKVALDAKVLHPALDLPAHAETTIAIVREIVVRNTNDSGPGSLRDAFDDANAHCTAVPCNIVFAVPAAGDLTITPETPLPAITADYVRIDARTQKAAVTIDGRRAGRGLEVRSSCDAAVRGFTLRNFDADQALWMSQLHPCTLRFGDAVWEITENVIAENLRGLRLDGGSLIMVRHNTISRNRASGIWMWSGDAWIDSNTFEANGASAVFLGPNVRSTEVIRNTITGHPHMGVAIAVGASDVDVRENRMRDNHGLGIDWGLDGVSPQRADDSATFGNAPVLHTAVYDAATNATQVTMSLHTKMIVSPGMKYVVIELFANRAYDTEGETPIFWHSAPTVDGTFTFSVPGDYRGKWLIATATPGTFFAAKPPTRDVAVEGYTADKSTTSEFSNTIPVN